nr:Regulator of rDNA transcription protein [Ipomoea batatas]
MADAGIVETVVGGGSRRARGKLTVEEYLLFIDSHKELELSVDHLREVLLLSSIDSRYSIIDMHGFVKMSKTPKKLVLEAVDSLELMNPGRSTLQDDSVSSHVHLTVEEVIKDLDDLKWQECCVTSLHTFNGLNHTSSQVQFQRSKVPAPLPANKRTGRPKKQKLSSTSDSIASYTTDIIDGGLAGNDSGGELRGENSASCSSVTAGTLGLG